jgi:hypothetical protein
MVEYKGWSWRSQALSKMTVTSWDFAARHPCGDSFDIFDLRKVVLHFSHLRVARLFSSF